MLIIDINGKQRNCQSIIPDPNNLGYMKITYKNAVRQHDEWYSIKDFLKNNPTLEHFITSGTQNKIAEELEDLGVVTKATADTLTDSSKNWQKNIYTDFIVWISRGKGESQTRKVTENTHNTLKLEATWDTIPDTTSQYVVTYNVHDPQVSGNELPTVPKPEPEVVESKP